MTEPTAIVDRIGRVLRLLDRLEDAAWLAERLQISSLANMVVSRRAAGRGSRAVGWARLWTSTAAAMAFRRDIARVFLG